jgi:hypothetical protein
LQVGQQAAALAYHVSAKTAAKEAWGNAKDAIHSIADSVKTRASSDGTETTKNAVTAKAQQIQNDLQRPA